MILNDINHDNNKVLKDDSNGTVKFHSLESIMEEAVYKFHTVIEVEQQNGGPQKKIPLGKK